MMKFNGIALDTHSKRMIYFEYPAPIRRRRRLLDEDISMFINFDFMI